MKRGSTHADWAVSLGIFLVYILSLFLLIQPGVEPVFKNENLIKIVENSFFDDTRLVIEKTPIIFTFKPTPEKPGGNYVAVIVGDIPIAVAVGGTFDRTDFSIKDIDKNDFHFEMTFSPDKTIISKITVQADFSAAVPTTTLYLYYSPRAYESLIAPSGTTIVEHTSFERVFGSTEVLSGIKKDIVSINPLRSISIDPLKVVFPCANQDDYLALKKDWDYPINKEFQIFMIPKPEPRYKLDERVDVCNQAQPYEQANVFVKERVDNTLDRDGNREPLRISLRVW